MLIVSDVTPASPWLEYTPNTCVEEVAAWSRRSIVVSYPTILPSQSKFTKRPTFIPVMINRLNTQVNPVCHLPVLLEVHHILHFSRIGVKQPVLSTQQAHCFFRAIIASFSDSRQIDVTMPRAWQRVSECVICTRLWQVARWEMKGNLSSLNHPERLRGPQSPSHFREE